MEFDYLINNNIDFIINDFEFDEESPYQFHKELDYYSPTPLYLLHVLAEELGLKKILVKDESKRFGLNAFKGLGALYAINKIIQKNPQKKFLFVTATDGNHGRAVAWASKKYNCDSVIFVPNNTVASRINNIRNEGASIVIVNGNYDEAVREANKFANSNGGVLVQDSAFENYTEIPHDIMNGYLTMMKELEPYPNNESSSAIDVVFLQSGVGSWAAVCAWYYKKKFKEKSPKIVHVEPFNSDCVLESIKLGAVTNTKKNQDTIMAGLNCGTPSTLALPLLKKFVDVFVTIPDEYSKLAMKNFYFPKKNDPQIISGESGAAGLAALLAIINEESLIEVKDYLKLSSNSSVLLFNTEGDTDPINFRNVIKSMG